ncbi:hypothetical protein Taro_039412 [Colocasia esculenta]|uniref:Uncharacterized protein n=1 Tax=Colocasia esculenta TaxID=4460 RepID=A0A843WQ47_COLES|nr:hypothetical protein [Colocasia esculenta]
MVSPLSVHHPRGGSENTDFVSYVHLLTTEDQITLVHTTWSTTTPTSLSATTQRNPGDRHDNLLHKPLVNSANSQALEHDGSSTRPQRLQLRALWLQTRVHNMQNLWTTKDPSETSQQRQGACREEETGVYVLGLYLERYTAVSLFFLFPHVRF